MGFFSNFFVSKDELKEKVKNLTQQHIHTLSKKRKILVNIDDYGRTEWEEWHKEIKYFIESHNVLMFDDFRNDEKFVMDVLYLIDDLIDNYEEELKQSESYLEFDENMTPTEYEYFCADILISQGLDARVTKQSGDQGVDIVTYDLDNKPYCVYQCKLYSSPVGNKAVQEIFAAKQHLGARYAVVVSNNIFTKSAIELASTTNVLLLHHYDLYIDDNDDNDE